MMRKLWIIFNNRRGFFRRVLELLARQAKNESLLKFLIVRCPYILKRSCVSFLATIWVLLTSKQRRRRVVRKETWLLIDRPAEGRDSAQVLFEYLSENPLRCAGKRITPKYSVSVFTLCYWEMFFKHGPQHTLAYGGLRWAIHLKTASLLLSSQADADVVSPPLVSRPSPDLQPFVFLQHGVTRDDISSWLNSKPIDLIVASTQSEFDSFCINTSSYEFGPDRVVLSGLPRFDRLRKTPKPQAGRFHRAKSAAPGTVLVFPTWREYFMKPSVGLGGRRTNAISDQFEAFVLDWLEIIGVARSYFSADRDLKVVWLAHPNLEYGLRKLRLPSHISVVPYRSKKVDALYQQAVLGVTDYSSTFFNLAFLRKPTIFYQNQDFPLFGSGHPSVPGYYNFETMGPGPVVSDVREFSESLRQYVEDGHYSNLFLDRAVREFSNTPQNSCEFLIGRIRNRFYGEETFGTI